MYSRKIQDLIRREKLSYGDEVSVERGGKTHAGTLMPPSELGESDSVILKLSSGYNIAISASGAKIRLLHRRKKPQSAGVKPDFKKGLKRVAVVATGGTITSKVDYETGGVTSLMQPKELLSLVPELSHMVNISSIESPFTRMSESMAPPDWQDLAKSVFDSLQGNDAAIVTHGTDTLHYTAAALSFMIRNPSKPIILTGSQRSSDRGSTDAAMNLMCSAAAAASGINGVSVCMHANSSDDYCHLMRGTKVRKMHTSMRNAFKSVNCLPIAEIYPNGSVNMLSETGKPKGKMSLDRCFDPRVALLKPYPGMSREALDRLVERKYRGIVIEAFGLGQVPSETRDERNSLLSSIKAAIKDGVLIAFAPQAIYGSLNPQVYSQARQMLDAGVVYLGDMLPETAYVKLGWVLGHDVDYGGAKRMMLENIAGEFSARPDPGACLY